MKPPANLSDLQRRIDQYRRRENIAPDRLHQRISSELFFGLLAAAKQQGVIPMFLLKGGMAMELRFGLRARASGDVDIGFVAPPDELIAVLDRVLAVGFAGFSFRRKGAEQFFQNAATYRTEIQIAYRGKPFSVLRVDLNEASYEATSDVLSTGVIVEFGLPGPLLVPALEPYLQTAQKLHGATEPSRADYENVRYRDVLDVLIFARNTTRLSFPRLRRIAIGEFARRPHHRFWPPVFRLPAAWNAALRNEAIAVHFAETDSSELEREFLCFIAAIEGVEVKPEYEYRFVPLQLVLSGSAALAPEGEAELRRYEDEGWKMIRVDLRPGYPDQMLAIFERLLDNARPTPRLQLRMRSVVAPGQKIRLTGELHNVNDQPANKVRVFMTAARPVARLGAITKSDGGIPVEIVYEDEDARTREQQFASIFVEYLTDDGRKIQQIGLLDVDSDGAHRHSYTLRGLGPPKAIATFQHRHDSLDDL